jgi:hypothetical protein
LEAEAGLRAGSSLAIDGQHELAAATLAIAQVHATLTLAEEVRALRKHIETGTLYVQVVQP